MEDSLADLYPVRERDTSSSATHASRRPASGNRTVSARQMDADLEDRLLRLQDEHLSLKKHAQEQEEKIKQLSTKLMRQISNKKKQLEPTSKDGQQKRNVDLQELLEDQAEQIRLLQKQNAQLRDKLSLARHRPGSGDHQPLGLYHDIRPKVDTNLPDRMKRRLRTRCTRVPETFHHVGRTPVAAKQRNKPQTPAKDALNGTVTISKTPSSLNTMLDRQSLKLVEDAHEEVKKLETMVSLQHEQIDAYRQELEALREQVHSKEAEEEEGLVSLRTQFIEGKRQEIQESIDVMRFQRDLKQKASKLSTLQAQYSDLEETMKALKESNEMLLRDMDVLQTRLADEQRKNLELHTELRKTAMMHKTILELQQQVSDLQRENQVLREANDKLIGSAFDLEHGEHLAAREKSLRLQMNQMEASLKSELKDKKDLIVQLAQEKSKFSQLDSTHKQLLTDHHQLKEKLEEMEKKLKDFTKDGTVELSELEAALALLRNEKQEQGSSKDEQIFDGILQKVDDASQVGEKDLRKQLLQVERHLAETASELEKTRDMLRVQYQINKDYQAEVDNLNKQVSEKEKEFQTRLEEYAHLLDLRNGRIKKLERQLRDVAYGTKQHKLDVTKDGLEEPETVQLERGQNLFEIHVQRVTLSEEWLQTLAKEGGDNDLSTFLTWEFYEFELQSTPVMKGPRPEFNCTSQYIVTMDDFLLHYLNKESVTLELHQAFGTDYKTVAACQIPCSDVLHQPQKHVHGKLNLIGAKMGSVGFMYGTVEYWIRLHLPAEQTALLYKERLKGLSYLESNCQIAETALKKLVSSSEYLVPSSQKHGALNELHIKVIRCSGLRSKNGDPSQQPSAYCVYKFYNLSDQDTAIVPSSNEPLFDDHRTFPLYMDADLDTYLRNSDLEIFVFDDEDPEIGSYLGKACIPLLPLAHNRPLKGTFHLKSKNGQVCGTIDVSLYWLLKYVPPESIELPVFSDQHRGSVTPDILKEKRASSSSSSSSEEAKRHKKAPVPLPRKSLTLKQQQNGSASSSHSSLQKEENDVKKSTSAESVFSKEAGQSEKSEDAASQEKLSEDKSDGKPESLSRRSSSKASIASDLPSVRSGASKDMVKDDSEAANNEDEVEEEEEIIEEEEEENEFTDGDAEEDGDDDGRSDGSQANADAEEEDDGEESRNPVSESGSESSEVVITTSPTNRGTKHDKIEDVIIITISSLQLVGGTRVLRDPRIQFLFVEYHFLNYPLEELETPYSLPKPHPPRTVNYNFRKVFHVDAHSHGDKRRLLQKMLSSNSAASTRIQFTVVSEPPENQQDKDCEEIGFAFVDLRKILKDQADLYDEPIEIHDVEDRRTLIGYLNVTVQALAALQSVIRTFT